VAHFAKIDENNTVVEVCVVNNDVITVNGIEYEAAGISFMQSITGHANWRQTSYNSSFRKNYAAPGYSYDVSRDAFVPPQPFASWVLEESTCRWQPPVAAPSDGNAYSWDEDSKSWVAVSAP
jgi:hypothetical protein